MNVLRLTKCVPSATSHNAYYVNSKLIRTRDKPS